MYILLISVWFGGYVDGYSVTTQEFSSRDKCEIAKQILSNDLKDGNNYHLNCVAK